DGDVNWQEFFGGLQEIGFLDSPDTILASSVFAENENAAEVSKYQLATIKSMIQKAQKA
ncbi:MAG: sugar phosphate isomerase/epimerase, partial [Corynebacterium sp.]|nr:sugar phosphate isomerase/epimerase [Corynebacterium sp.]